MARLGHAQGVEAGLGDAPGLADGLLAPGQDHGLEMAQPGVLQGGGVHGQAFAAPQGVVLAEPGAVQGQAHHRSVQHAPVLGMLGQHGVDMGVVVLQGQHGQGVLVLGVAGGQVVGVQIAHQGLGLRPPRMWTRWSMIS